MFILEPEIRFNNILPSTPRKICDFFISLFLLFNQKYAVSSMSKNTNYVIYGRELMRRKTGSEETT
jgi:hypothetical protein